MTPINTDPVDYALIIKGLGGPKAVHAALALPDLAPRAVLFWEKRNSVPGKYAPALLSLAIGKGLFSDLASAPRVDPFAEPA
jgi:hypothetical protein